MKKLIFGLFLIPNVVFGYTITHNDYTSGATITASAQNTNENNIVNLLNGNIDSTNISAASINTGRLAAGAALGNIAANSITGVYLSSPSVNGSTNNSGGTQGQITQGTISTPDLRANAVTNSTGTSNMASLTEQSVTILSKSITTIGGNVIIMANMGFRCTTGSANPIVTLFNGTSVIGGCTAAPSGSITATWISPCVITAIDSPAAGTYTYNMEWSNTANCDVTSQPRSLVVFELRK